MHAFLESLEGVCGDAVARQLEALCLCGAAMELDEHVTTSRGAAPAVTLPSAPSTNVTSKPSARSFLSCSRSGGSSSGAASNERTHQLCGSRSGAITSRRAATLRSFHALRYTR
eukprot:scaffold40430_cov65-Phaeocystis_antarctica.AAC.21